MNSDSEFQKTCKKHLCSIAAVVGKWYSDADYTICIRKLWSYKSLNCPSFCSIKVRIIQLLRELHKFRDFGTYYVALCID